MKILHFALFTCLLSVQSLPAINTHVSATETFMGPLNPPSNFAVQNISTEWADLTWTPVQGAANYLIKTYDRVNGNLIHTVTVSGSVSTTRVTWPDMVSGGNESKIWSVDALGVQSINYSAAQYDKIILELVTTGYAFYDNIVPQCILALPATSCSNFTWGENIQTTFKVTTPANAETSDVCLFTMKGYIAADHIAHLKLAYQGVIPSSDYFIKKNSTGTAFNVMYGTVHVSSLVPAALNVNSNSPTGFITRSPEDNFAHVIKKIGAGPGLQTNSPSILIDKRDLDPTLSDLKTIPNPFRDILTLELPDTDNQAAANVHLYDLLGAVKRSFAAPADQRTITFDTADLTPGVYFLRVETGGQIETIKVVKTQ